MANTPPHLPTRVTIRETRAINYAVAFDVQSLPDFLEAVATAVNQCLIAVDGTNVHGYVHLNKDAPIIQAWMRLNLGRSQVRMLEKRNVRPFIERLASYEDTRVLARLSHRYAGYFGKRYEVACVAGDSMSMAL